eukprot:NODE_854_length_1737_cov_29.325829_g700_i0.p12 GENE.NODE_854_length_1737_cov_29.325829_g700_i0~~NODE_854_length_1737_cov_29.325829_g700_i0.p12  ORF type:complete len:54 (+),score=13.84 NODE_854_length_1737_cov_29.325829_g700_i0:1468-1629(+)
MYSALIPLLRLGLLVSSMMRMMMLMMAMAVMMLMNESSGLACLSLLRHSEDVG